MPGRFWKWRMHGGAITLAEEFRARNTRPDLIIATSMLDLSSFLALTRDITWDIPAVMYFHENQFAYPWQETDRDILKGRDMHYCFINFVSALAADHVFFNSRYNMLTFLQGAKKMLRHFPDFNQPDSIETLKQKCSCLHLGIDFSDFNFQPGEQGSADCIHSPDHIPIIIWNHRWEHDKNPGAFFNALFRLDEEGFAFRLILLGENFRQRPQEFIKAEEKLGRKILHSGFVKDHREYASWLNQGTLLPVTSRHDFFGVSVCEAIYCGCFPIIPDRVAYPEIINPLCHKDILYNGDEEFYKRLREEMLLWNHRERRLYRQEVIKKLQAHISKFSWDNAAPEYDATFRKVIREFKMEKQGIYTAP